MWQADFLPNVAGGSHLLSRQNPQLTEVTGKYLLDEPIFVVVQGSEVTYTLTVVDAAVLRSDQVYFKGRNLSVEQFENDSKAECA